VNKAKKRKTRKFLPAKSSSFKVFILGRNEISSAPGYMKLQKYFISSLNKFLYKKKQ